MGEYAHLKIAGYTVDSWKNGIGVEVSTLFTHADFGERLPSDEERSESMAGDEDLPRYVYASTAGKLLDRLNVMGYTAERSEEAFSEGVEQLVDRALSLMEHLPECKDLTPQAWEAEEARIEARFNGVTFELWSSHVRRIIAEQRPWQQWLSEQERLLLETEAPELRKMIEQGSEEYGLFGFPCEDASFAYRAFLQLVAPDTVVELDVTHLVGWVGEENYTCNAPRIIILTEGSSDNRILELTLACRYPHLRDYFSFLDFETFRAPGSTGHLLNLVKALAGAGIANQIVALFDNDTAGHDAMRQLYALDLPDNIRVMSLPDLDLARNYPTLGPQGQVSMDVNGSACSIELYLGIDTLEASPGNLTPIQWMGYNVPMNRYQGEVLNKASIQQRYLARLAAIIETPELGKDHDWDGMETLWKAVFWAAGS